MVTKAPHGVPVRTVAYQNFQGLDSTRDVTALDTGNKQALALMQDGFCDWRGQITRDPGATKIYANRPVRHIVFYGSPGVCWAEDNGEFVRLESDNGQVLDAYAAGTILTSVVFNRKAHFFAPGQQSWYFDGAHFKLNQSQSLDNIRPSFGCVVARRLAVAGIPGRETEVDLSRVDDHEVFPDDEPENSTAVTRASYFDIANVIGKSEPITGLGRFEQSNLAVFTSDRALVYQMDPDLSQWSIDDRASINVGCVSHATIQPAGDQLLYCSRSGIHALSRAEYNGLVIGQQPISAKVDILYRSLLASVDDPQKISAVWDQDMMQYHVFFPQPGGILSRRLTVTMVPGGDPTFSTGIFLNASCGAAQGGALLFGGPEGIFQIGKIESEFDDVYPDMVVSTPMLWHGTLTDIKSTHSLIIQAHGKGTIELKAINDEGRIVGSDVFEVDDTQDDNSFPDVPLSTQYERKFEVRYRGCRYVMVAKGKGLFRIVGFAVVVRKE